MTKKYVIQYVIDFKAETYLTKDTECNEDRKDYVMENITDEQEKYEACTGMKYTGQLHIGQAASGKGLETEDNIHVEIY